MTLHPLTLWYIKCYYMLRYPVTVNKPVTCHQGPLQPYPLNVPAADRTGEIRAVCSLFLFFIYQRLEANKIEHDVHG